jgi:nucleoside-diphosphate-sugar epimerase
MVGPDTPPAPADFYSFTKLAGEQCLAQYSSFYSTLVLRPFQPYGPGQVDKLLPNLARRILAGDELHLTSGTSFGFLHVRDAVDLTVAAAHRMLDEGGHRTFDLGAREVVSLEDVAAMLARALGRPLLARLDESAPGAVVAADCSDLYEFCGREPRIDLAEGLAELAASLRGAAS